MIALKRTSIPCSLAALAILSAPATAEQAKLHLNDGAVLRGDVTLSRAEAVINTQVGEARYPRVRVERIEWLEPAADVQSEYMRRFYAIAPDATDEHFELAEWLVEQGLPELANEQCVYVLELAPQHAGALKMLGRAPEEQSQVPESQPVEVVAPAEEEADGGEERLSAPPPLSESDILKLKLSEIDLDGPAERLVVRFKKQRDEPDVIEAVRKEMTAAADYDPQWEEVLDRGQLHEKLQVVVTATGLKYADRIDLRTDPETFATYRRRVLPLINRGCIRSGCHGGPNAEVFRFPPGSRTSDGYVYTSFAIIDRLDTKTGPLLDRGSPEKSALLRYMLPAEVGRAGHPKVDDRNIVPITRGTHDPRYQATVEWIDSLRTPHPDYQLEYEWPEWLTPVDDRDRVVNPD